MECVPNRRLILLAVLIHPGQPRQPRDGHRVASRDVLQGRQHLAVVGRHGECDLHLGEREAIAVEIVVDQREHLVVGCGVGRNRIRE